MAEQTFGMSREGPLLVASFALQPASLNKPPSDWSSHRRGDLKVTTHSERLPTCCRLHPAAVFLALKSCKNIDLLEYPPL